MNSLNWMKKTWRACAAMLLGVASLAQAAPPPVDHFTRQPAIEDVVISPSGKRLAVLVFGPDGMRRVGVMNLDPIGEPRVVGEFSNADVTSVHWVNDDRLVFEAFERGPEIREGMAGTYAVNHDGGDLRQLISWQRWTGTPTGSNIGSRVLPYGWFFHSTIGDGSDDIFVVKKTRDHKDDLKEVLLARLNTATRELQSLSYGVPDGTVQWFLDAKREPRMVVAAVAGRRKVYWRAGKEKTWEPVADFDPLSKGAFEPWFIDADGQVLVTASPQSDVKGLYKFDPLSKRLNPEPVVAISGFDLDPDSESDFSTGRLVGLHFRADRPMSYWFDEGLNRVQKGLDAALPGRTNRLYCGRCESSRFLVVRSGSDRQPAEYFLFDREKSALQRIGAARPWIKEATQGTRTFHRVMTRDGKRMPVYVTHPAGTSASQPLPAVALIHGGPWVRGADTGWNAEAQFLASRGYRVIEPEFRGSTGYGFQHFNAGWKQWGRAMQDDIADAVEWAAKQGLTDSKRVCIMGGSYGGYAALMGPIAHPGTYRCAVSFAGVTDIGLMYDITWSDISDYVKKYDYPVLMGDPKTDGAVLDKASPIKRAGEIKVPVLVVHGALDSRVPIQHAYAFVGAARSAGVDVEQVDYKDEGHGFFHVANHTDYYTRVERFLEKSLRVAP